ncbi:hypothetical protein LO763_22700 [Glycomyces sp. A-F 0318]|uniref:hypothetical protein n=1 Tax=Glycomyces amatae TaxID=2881355 RepID=UPI001E53ADC5|nr:hypothetical protein [Glycomyces amatae]MCD0446430.1 hypothetical protein [Glycomyces amatae]
MNTTTVRTERVNVRLDTHVSAVLTSEAAWRRCTRSDLAAALIAWHLDTGPAPALADPPRPRPTGPAPTLHTSFTLPAGLWNTFRDTCCAGGRTAPATLTRLLRWMLGDETPPPRH